MKYRLEVQSPVLSLTIAFTTGRDQPDVLALLAQCPIEVVSSKADLQTIRSVQIAGVDKQLLLRELLSSATKPCRLLRMPQSEGRLIQVDDNRRLAPATLNCE